MERNVNLFKVNATDTRRDTFKHDTANFTVCAVSSQIFTLWGCRRTGATLRTLLF
jgi:hypothetical protein